jgi:hypothetical protein
MKWQALAAALALTPLGLQAADCKFSAKRSLDLDLGGVTSVRFDVGGHTLRLKAGDPGIEGRACSSNPDQLDAIVLRQRRIGDELRVELSSETRFSGLFLSPTYAYLDLDASLPASLPVALELGSGDLLVEGMNAVNVDMGSGDLVVHDGQSLRLSVGSGDAEAERIAGEVRVEVGSGDINLRDIGSLLATRVGSGDLEARGIRGDARIEDLGSGDVEIEDVGGNVVAEDIGSGDLSVSDIKGDLQVDEIGTGDVDHRRVSGKVSLPED